MAATLPYSVVAVLPLVARCPCVVELAVLQVAAVCPYRVAPAHLAAAVVCLWDLRLLLLAAT